MATATVEDGRELEAFEPDDFWASGETQQFVGASRSVTAPEIESREGDEDDSSRSLPGEPVARSEPRWRRLSVGLPTKVIAAAVVLCALAGTGIASVFLIAPSSQRPPHVSVDQRHASTAAIVRTPWIARAVRHRTVTHRARRAHRHKPSTRTRRHAVAAAGTPVSSTPSVSTTPPTTATQPAYQAPPPAAASTTHHRSSGGHHAGPTGTVSLIGAGTSPSG